MFQVWFFQSNTSISIHRKRGLRFKKSFKSWVWRPNEGVEFCLGRRRLTFACSPRPDGRCHTWFGTDGKVVIERWYLSPYVEKPYNSKVIKSFVPELRSRKCFSRFGIPMFYVYMSWTFYVRFTYSCMAMLQFVYSPQMISNLLRNKRFSKTIYPHNVSLWVFRERSAPFRTPRLPLDLPWHSALTCGSP